MLNGIIINGTAYELVETDGFFTEACKKCAFRERCEETREDPCDLFETKDWGYFVKVEDNK